MQLRPAFRSQPVTGLAQLIHVSWPGASAHSPKYTYERRKHLVAERDEQTEVVHAR